MEQVRRKKYPTCFECTAIFVNNTWDHCLKHFCKSDSFSYCVGSANSIRKNIEDTLRNPDSYDVQGSRCVCVKSFSKVIGFARYTHQPCDTLRIVLEDVSSDYVIIKTIYPEDLKTYVDMYPYLCNLCKKALFAVKIINFYFQEKAPYILSQKMTIGLLYICVINI